MKKLSTILICLQLICSPVALGQESSYDKTAAGDGGYDFYTKQVIMLATSVLGSSILTQCPQGLTRPSMIGYMSGSLVFILSEMLAAEAENQRHKKAMSDIEMVEENMPKQGGEVQKAALEASLENERKLLEYVTKKRDWMIAITTIFTASMGLAIAEELYSHAAGATAAAAVCGSSMGVACVGAPPPSGALAAESAFANPNGLGLGTLACAGGAACLSYLNAFLPIASAGCSPLQIVKHDLLNSVLIGSLVGAYGFAVNQVEGGDISKWGMLLTSGIMMVSSSATKLVTAAYNYPIPRAITFGANAVLGGVILAGLQQRANAAEKNIERLTRVLQDFKITTEEAGGLGTTSTVAEDGSPLSPPKAGELTRLSEGAKYSGQCLGSNMKISSAGCKTRVRVSPPKIDIGGIGDLTRALSLGADAANALTEFDAQGAEVARSGLINAATRIRNATEELEKKYNAQQVTEKKRPVDFDKEINKKVSELQQVMDQAAAANGIGSTGSKARATLDSEPANSLVGDSQENKSASAVTGTLSDRSALDFGLEEADFKTPEKMATSGEGLDQYETHEADISKKSDVSIFLQLSNRYLLNYTKIFNKKESPGTRPLESAKK